VLGVSQKNASAIDTRHGTVLTAAIGNARRATKGGGVTGSTVHPA